MYFVRQFIVSRYRHLVLYPYFLDQAFLACNLYNASLFRIRQIFTGWDKPCLSDNEAEVFLEVEQLKYACPSIGKISRVISYCHLEKLMRATNNPDFFAGLPMQTAQAVVKQAVQDFRNWLAALKDYEEHPEKYTGRPRMPRYKKPGGMATYAITNQDAVIYEKDGSSWLKLPHTKERLELGVLPAGAKLAECRVKPFYGRFIVSLTFEAPEAVPDHDMPNIAAIDFGTHNAAAIVCTDLSSRLYKGGAILSENQFFAKRRAKLAADITRGKKHAGAESKRLDNLSFHHANFNRDQCHKISADIVRFCVEHRAGVLVLGVNKDQKQGLRIGHRNNQLFYGMPLFLLRQMITYKAQAAGVEVVIQEESYTSKADFTACDHIPVYGVDDENASFSGRRIGRGLYRCHDGRIINADLNGAANILRKAFPNAFYGVTDHAFLSDPEVSGFRELNPQRIPVERIEAA